MKTTHTKWLLTALCVAIHTLAPAATIEWSSPTDGTNLDSNGNAMCTGFIYELGVFTSGFEPTPSNVADWDANWHCADRVSRSSVVNAFGSSFRVWNNSAPFTSGAKGWILGKKETPTGTEKILFRNSNWIWPSAQAATAGPSLQREWHVDAKSPMDEVVLGSVNPEGSPHLMQSTVVFDYDQWANLHFEEGEASDPNESANGDDVPNLLKFAFGMNPHDKGGRPETPVGKMLIGNDEFLKMTVPRHGISLANMRVQVSSDLQHWQDDEDAIEVVADDQSAWVVRDKTPFAETGGKRFMRLKIEAAE